MRNRAIRSKTPVLVILAGIAMVTSGCEHPIGVPAAYTGPTLCSDSFGVGKVQCPSTGFVLLEQEKSRGRFPCTIAVARLVPAEKDPFGSPQATDWALGDLKEEEATYWTSLFNTVRDIQAVLILDRLNMEHPEANLEKIAATAERMKAGLCVIWGPGPAHADQASLLGVIMDSRRRERIACVQAVAGPQDFLEPTPDQMHGDLSHEDVNYIVARKFQQQVRNCIDELRARDVRAPATQPSPWGATSQPANRSLVPVYIIPNRSTNW
jgi:hypothetical protein